MQPKVIHLVATTALIIAVGILFSNCSAPTSSTDTTVSSALSSFATTLSEDMVLTSPTAERSGTSILSQGSRYVMMGDVMVMTAPAADDSPKEKKDALEDLLAATAPVSCAISLTIQNAGRANCYGPSVAFTDHEVDGTTDGSWPGGDLGIWEETEASGEACAAAQLTAQMKGVISYVDTAQFIGAGMACVANKAGDALPSTEGSTLDLTAAMAGIVTINSTAVTVSAASISREANDSSGNSVYVTSLIGTAGTKTYSIRIKHVPTAVDDSTNKGKISVTVSDSGTPSTDGVSLQYEKSSSSVGKFLLKKTNFSSAGASPFVSGSDYTVDFSKPWAGNADYFLAQVDPSKYTGTFSYAWQAGNGDSNTRVFNAVLSEASGVVTGSAFFGFGPTVQTGAGSIDGMICAWTGPDQTHTPVTRVQRQNMTLTSGKFALTGTSYTVFDPVAACDAVGTMSMSWGTSSTRLVSATTENLVPVAEVATAIGTLPTAPPNVD